MTQRRSASRARIALVATSWLALATLSSCRDVRIPNPTEIVTGLLATAVFLPIIVACLYVYARAQSGR